MGYRSQIRCLIYGDPDVVQALWTKHELLGSGLSDEFMGSVQRYRAQRSVPDREAMEHNRNLSPEGKTSYISRDIEVEVIDMTGDDWKWYDSYPSVQAWNTLMRDAPDMGLNYEFVRLGEEDSDIEMENHIDDDGDQWLGMSRQIICDVAPPPDDETTFVKIVNETETSDG